MNLISLIKNYLFEWKQVEKTEETWNVVYNIPFFGKKTIVRTCHYIICFSSKKKKYKLFCTGFHPRKHSKHNNYVKRVNYLNSMSSFL